ncbi:MAG: TonB-dependent receptor plug domain-containing protein [Polyangiaceae bacterium]
MTVRAWRSRRAKAFLVASLVAGTSASVPGTARADDDPKASDTSDLEALLGETVVTTASKASESSSVAPGTSTVVTAEDFRRYGVRSLDEAINFLALGVVTSNPLRIVDIGARGVMLPNDNGDHVLLLIDGHHVNEPMFGSARFERGLGMPFEMIDRVEVILGPGAVLYGSNAMLGVVNVITKRAKDWKGVHAVVDGEPGKSIRALAGFGHEFALFGTKLELTAGAEYYDHSGPTMFYVPQYGGVDTFTLEPARYRRFGPPTGWWGGFASESYYTKVPSAYVRAKLGDLEVAVHGKTYLRSAPYRTRYTNNFGDFDEPKSYELDRELFVDARYKITLSPVVRLSIRGYADTFDFQNERVVSQAAACFTLGTSKTCDFYTQAASQWGGVEAQGTFDWFQNESFVTLLGVDGRLRHGGSKTDQLDYATSTALASSFGVVNRDDYLLGGYLQQTWQPTNKIAFNAGARLDGARGFDPVLNPRIAGSVKPWDGGTIKVVYSEAFRTPSMVELDYQNPIQILSKDLRPEKVRSIEASVEERFGSQRVLFGLFRSWWSNLVEQHVLSDAETTDAIVRGELALTSYGAAQFRNVSSIDNFGFNGTYEGSLGSARQFRYGVNATGTVARRNESGTKRPLAVAPQMFGNARVSYDFQGPWPTVAVAASYVGRRPADRAYDGGWVPLPYADPQLEVRATISGPFPFVKGLAYRATAGYAVADTGPYVVGPGQGRFGDLFPYPVLRPRRPVPDGAAPLLRPRPGSGRTMRIRRGPALFVIGTASAVVLGVGLAATGCLDLTPIEIVPKEAGPKPKRDVGPDEVDGGDPSCLACVQRPNAELGCADEIATCVADPKCNLTYQCVIEEQCFEEFSQEDKIRCGFPCVERAGVVSLTDKTIGLILTVVKCAENGCQVPCHIGDGGVAPIDFDGF